MNCSHIAAELMSPLIPRVGADRKNAVVGFGYLFEETCIKKVLQLHIMKKYIRICTRGITVLPIGLKNFLRELWSTL